MSKFNFDASNSKDQKLEAIQNSAIYVNQIKNY